MVLDGKKFFKIFLVLLAAAVIIRIGVGRLNRIQFGDGIALIQIDGVIGEGGGSALIRSSGSYLEQLQTAAADPKIKAIILRINSPGGAAAASQELYQTVLRIRQQGKPVIASLGDTAASGGYYAAAAADYIYANGSTITGSIGVIMQTTNLTELYHKLGIDVDVIKSGEFKDIGSSSRPMRDDERELLTDLIMDAWDQFVEDVATARNLPREQLEAVADGRIMTGRQALEAGLVDAIGTLEDAEQKALELANITGPYYIQTYQEQPSLLGRLLSIIDSLVPQAGLSLRYPWI